MSEKPHRTLAQASPDLTGGLADCPWWPVWPWVAAIWLIVAAGCWLGPVCGQWLLDRLPQSEPDINLHDDQVALAVSRLLMTPRIASEALTPLLDLWATAPSLDADDCLYGGLLAEHSGHPGQARVWLALEALCREDRPRAASLLAETGIDIQQLYRARMSGNQWLFIEPLGLQLTGALATD